MNLDKKLLDRMKRFTVIPAEDGRVIIRDNDLNKDLATFYGPGAEKAADMMYRDILGIDNPGNAGVTS